MALGRCINRSNEGRLGNMTGDMGHHGSWFVRRAVTITVSARARRCRGSPGEEEKVTRWQPSPVYLTQSVFSERQTQRPLSIARGRSMKPRSGYRLLGDTLHRRGGKSRARWSAGTGIVARRTGCVINFRQGANQGSNARIGYRTFRKVPSSDSVPPNLCAYLPHVAYPAYPLNIANSLATTSQSPINVTTSLISLQL